MALQTTHGNRFVQRVLARARAPRVSRLQRVVVPTKANLKDRNQISALTIEGLQRYAEEQVDWHTSPKLLDVDRGQVRALLDLARRPSIQSGCARMPVQKLIDIGLIKSDFSFDANILDPLLDYGGAVSGEVETVEIKNPTASPTTAVNWGKALKKLQDAPSVGGTVLKIIMPQAEFEQLVNKKMVDSFIDYCTKCTPRLEAEEGVEIQSYLALRAEGVDPVTYLGTSLKDRIRNFHRFERAALDRLVKNFNTSISDPAKRKPLTVVLHSAMDHNGAFHRDPGLTAVITNTKILTLVLEGKESIDDVKGQIGPLASAYGKDGKIDQTMIAGHGNARTIELAGAARFKKATATKDHHLGDDRLLEFDTGDQISVMEAVQTGIGKGSFKGKVGYFKFAYTDLAKDPIATPGGLNLNSNAAASDALFDELLKNMANDPAVAPHRRIVFNACLTNSNAVPIPLDADQDTAAKQVRDHIAAKSSLATYVQNRARSQGMDKINVLGANGSIGVVTLIDKTDGLDIISDVDPKVTADKLVYVAEGQEPEGTLRAVLECWAGVGETDAPAQKKRRDDCFVAMETRVKKAPADWDQAVIHALFSLILAKYKTDGDIIRQLAGAAGALGELKHESECRVSALRDNELATGGALATDAPTIFAALTKDSLWTSAHHLPLVIHQVWMHHDKSKTADFMAVLGHFNCQTANQFLDIEALETLLPTLLPLGKAPTAAQLLLAFRAIDTDDSLTDAKAFLLAAVDQSAKRFPAALKVGDILKGKPSEQVILTKIGLGVGSSSAPSADKKANLDLDGDGTNETYVEPLPGATGITLAAKTIVRAKPEDAATQLSPELAKDSRVVILGKLDNYYAIQFAKAQNGVAFIEKNMVLPL